jgi:hypothetical protein
MTNDQIILVPQGFEYQAVCRGLVGVAVRPRVISIPVGSQALRTYLHKLQAQKQLLLHPQMQVLLMGVCGSLSPRYSVGDVVLYENCIYRDNCQECDRTFTAEIYSRLADKVYLVKSLTSDRVICTAAEKQYLGGVFTADVVDMEGFAVLDFFGQLGVPVTMLRVISDDAHDDIPDLTSAFDTQGAIKPLSLALAFIQQPVAAIRLIRGSLQGLKALENITRALYGEF